MGRIRSALFGLGSLAVLLSIVLIIASSNRHIDTQDYFKQAEEGIPWVQWGLGSSILGFVLCFFGRKWWRIIGVFLGLLLTAFWFFQAESLF